MIVSVTMTGGLRSSIEMTFSDDPDNADVTISGEGAEFVGAVLSDGERFGHAHYSPFKGLSIVNAKSIPWVLAEIDRARRFGEGVEALTIVDALDVPSEELPEGFQG